MFKPFDSDVASEAIEDLILENGLDRINLYGNLQLTKDQQGLTHAKLLQSYLDAIVKKLESESELPQKIEILKEREIDNPFS